jgi:hypothetical protein
VCGVEPETSYHATITCTKARALRNEMRKIWDLCSEEVFKYTGSDWLPLLLGNLYLYLSIKYVRFSSSITFFELIFPPTKIHITLMPPVSYGSVSQKKCSLRPCLCLPSIWFHSHVGQAQLNPACAPTSATSIWHFLFDTFCVGYERTHTPLIAKLPKRVGPVAFK